MAPDDGGIVDDALLTETGSGGVFASGYLAEQPLEAYLEGDERPRFVFPSGHRGVVHDDGTGETVHAPGSGYRALVALTGRRAVLAVGDDDGDRSFEIPFDAVGTIEANAGIRRSRVTLTMKNGDRWHLYPEGTDVAEVREYLETAVAAWDRFERRRADAEDALSDAGAARAAGELADAGEACERAAVALSDAREALEAFEEPAPEMERRLEMTREERREERQQLIVARSRSRLERAERYWREEAYERAADEYERARDALEAVLDEEPAETAADIRTELARIDQDLDRLREAPVRQALAAERAAERTDDPETAIERWRDAYDRFRTVLELDWGRDQSRFDGGREMLSEHLDRAITGLLIARRRAADRQSQAANRLESAGRVERARSSYDDALEHLESAITTAREFAPAELDGLRDRHSEIGRRLDALPEMTSADEDGSPADEGGETDGAGDGSAARETSGDTAGRPADTGADELVATSTGERDRYVRHLQTLDDGGAVLAVAVIWQELGWSIDRIDDGASDVLATRPGSERPLLLAVRRRGVPLGAGGVHRLVSVADEREDEPAPVLVTTDPVKPAAFEAAMVRGITLVDGPRLGELARLTGVRPEMDTEDG